MQIAVVVVAVVAVVVGKLVPIVVVGGRPGEQQASRDAFAINVLGGHH
jgi:hypothetical protein